MNVIKDVKFKYLTSMKNEDYLVGWKDILSYKLTMIGQGMNQSKNKLVSIDSYYKFEKGQQGCMDMFEHSDGLYRYYEGD